MARTLTKQIAMRTKTKGGEALCVLCCGCSFLIVILVVSLNQWFDKLHRVRQFLIGSFPDEIQIELIVLADDQELAGDGCAGFFRQRENRHDSSRLRSV